MVNGRNDDDGVHGFGTISKAKRNRVIGDADDNGTVVDDDDDDNDFITKW